MGLMASFERGMERFLVPVAIKLNSQKHVAAVRDGFVFTFPIIMASSLIILINFAILSPDGFIAGLLHLNSIFPNLEKAQAIFTPVMNGSVNIMSIMIAFLVARNMAISYEQDDLLCGLTASWKSLKRTIKKGPNGPFNYCVCSSSVTGQRRNIMIDQINAAKAGTAPT